MIPGAGTPTPFHSASLYVGDLNTDVSEGLLFEIFNTVGPVASIRVCRDAVTRRSLGYAYVNFHNVQDAERALDTMNYTLIKGRPCRIMWSQRDPSLRKSGVGNIFVKNLDESIDHKALYDTFSLFGNILSCKVATDEESKSKGYGYVHYETAEAANEAIAKINGMKICDKEVYVGHFVRRNERPGQADWTNCYVKNFPVTWTDVELRAHFEKFGPISSAKVASGKADEEGEEGEKGRGFGWVNFEDHESADKAVEALNNSTEFVDGDEIKDNMYVGRAQKKAERERELRTKFEALKQEQINKFQGVNLYIKNIDEVVTDEELREKFTTYGTITSARIMRDTNATSRGFGFVCYSAPEEATKAANEMNGQLMGGKPIFVALAQRKEVRRAQLEAQHAQRMSAMGAAGRGGAPMVQSPMYAAMPMMYAQAGPGMPQGPGQAGPGHHAQAGPGGAPRGYPMMAQMMGGPRGAPRGPAGMHAGPYGPGAGRGQYAMPAYAMGVVNQQGGPQGGRRGRSRGAAGPGGRGQGNMRQGGMVQQGGMPGGQQGMQGGQGGARGQGGQQGGGNTFKYTQQVRNMPGAPPTGGMQQQPGMVQGGPGMPPAGGAPQQQGQAGSAAQMQPQQQEQLTLSMLANATPAGQKNMIGERLYPLIFASQPELAGKITGMLLEMDNGELLHLLESPEALRAKIQEALDVLQQHQAQLAAQANEEQS